MPKPKSTYAPVIHEESSEHVRLTTSDYGIFKDVRLEVSPIIFEGHPANRAMTCDDRKIMRLVEEINNRGSELPPWNLDGIESLAITSATAPNAHAGIKTDAAETLKLLSHIRRMEQEESAARQAMTHAQSQIGSVREGLREGMLPADVEGRLNVVEAAMAQALALPAVSSFGYPKTMLAVRLGIYAQRLQVRSIEPQVRRGRRVAHGNATSIEKRQATSQQRAPLIIQLYTKIRSESPHSTAKHVYQLVSEALPEELKCSPRWVQKALKEAGLTRRR